MYQVIKVLNNNTILAQEEEREVIVMYKGIGFGKRVDDMFEAPSAAKRYIMQKGNPRKSSAVIDHLNPIFLEISSRILQLATDKFKDIDEGILLPLADHICFAIKRMDENIMPSNPFANDIRLLFPDEYEVAVDGKKIIEEMTGKIINEDEIGYITLHIHSAISSSPVTESMEAAQIIHESIQDLETELHITIDMQSISYIRLMNHIKFLILRLNTNEKLQMDISDFTKKKFPFAYEQASNICNALSKTLKKDLPENEIGYLALHLERILSSVT